MRSVVLALCVLAGCRAEIPVGVFVCDGEGECPPGQVCDVGAGLCVVDACDPLTCEQFGWNCGSASDGCGGTLECGTCVAPERCGDGGAPNYCGCIPDQTCAGIACGEVDDGCGNILRCGGCGPFRACTDNVCGECADGEDPCVRETRECGFAVDPCGMAKRCGECAATESCNRGECSLVACSLDDCESLGIECGFVSDGCEGTLNCGGCANPMETCGGGGVRNECGCATTVTCDGSGAECGAIPDGCGGTLRCEECEEPALCESNRCVCRDVYEPNEDAAGARDLGARRTTSGADISGSGDSDWFFVDFLNEDALEAVVAAERRSMFGFTVYQQCVDTDQRPVCLAGDPVEDTNGSGCTVMMSGLPMPLGGSRVAIDPACTSGRLLIRLESAGTRFCTPYELMVGPIG